MSVTCSHFPPVTLMCASAARSSYRTSTPSIASMCAKSSGLSRLATISPDLVTSSGGGGGGGGGGGSADLTSDSACASHSPPMSVVSSPSGSISPMSKTARSLFSGRLS